MPRVRTAGDGDRRGGKPKSFEDLVKGKEEWEFWIKRGEKKRVLRNSGRCRWEFHVKGWKLCHRLMTLPQTCVCVPFHVHADLQSCYAVLCWWQSMLNHNHDAVTVSHIYIWTYDMELDNTRTSPHSPIQTNWPNMAQVDQSEIHDLILYTDIQQYTNMVICTLLVYDTRE